MPATSPARPVALALDLARVGWHILPLSPASKRPLANCPTCRKPGSCRPDTCPCLRAGDWCHGVRAATTQPDRIRSWWQRQPDAVPGVAAGPSELVLIDLDAHTDQPPADLAAELLPGIDLNDHPAGRDWATAPAEPGRYHGQSVLRLLAHIRGGPTPWPTDPEHQPVTVATPSGGRHLWYRAPAPELRQALSELGWQIDIKAGWSYGIAPGAHTRKGAYRHLGGDLEQPGRMPAWLAREVVRAAQTRPRPTPAPPPRPATAAGRQDHRTRYLTTVIQRGAAELATLTDGRQRALSALAYKAGGLLAWAGTPENHVTSQLVTAGTDAGLPERTARRIVQRALANGTATPLPDPQPPRPSAPATR